MYNKSNNVFLKKIFLILILQPTILFSVPQPVTDLQVIGTNYRQIKIKWTTPASEEPVVYYQIRVSTYRVLSTEDDWNNNSTQQNYPYIVEIDTSTSEGNTNIYTFTNLENFKTYFFAIKSSTSSDKIPLSYIDNTLLRPYGQPSNNIPMWTGVPILWPSYGVVVTSTTFITFDFTDAFDPDISYGDTIKYELYYS
ncbi:MAG: fibronectin type III domain-containing protein, partial [Endomicrobia bacterium]|nr:fibronectin type III domain-containing protein [Endomicrobiia bacterium]